MTESLRSLVKAAVDRPLEYPISMYVGQAVVTGWVAPNRYWREATIKGVDKDVERRVREIVFSKRKKQDLRDSVEALRSDFKRILDDGGADDELTLINATVFPAVGTVGTKSGGFLLPVAKVALASIAMWWIAEGTEIPGSGGFRGGLSFGIIEGIG